MCTININHEISIPEREISFTTSRSGGPGGQNVNKVNTRITLWFNVDHSESLSEDQKLRIRKHLATRINKNGDLWIVSRQHRTQLANREAAVQRFAELLRGALKLVRPRKKTKPSAAAKKHRLENKRKQSHRKKDRTKIRNWED